MGLQKFCKMGERDFLDMKLKYITLSEWKMRKVSPSRIIWDMNYVALRAFHLPHIMEK